MTRDRPTSPYARAMDLGAGVLLLIAAILGRPAARMNRDMAGLLVLVDTSLTSETGWRWLYPGTRGDRAVRAFLRLLGRIGVPQLYDG